MRAFFAIIPPEELISHLLAVLKPLKYEISADYIQWIAVENLHITLHFIGQLQLEHQVALSEQVRNELKNISKFRLKFGALEWFPSSLHPKVLSLLVEPHEALSRLAHIIARVVSTFNYPIESRAFRGHMSLGRVRRYEKKRMILPQIKLGEIPSVLIDRVYLMESKSDRKKVIYSPLTQFELQK